MPPLVRDGAVEEEGDGGGDGGDEEEEGVPLLELV